jgi:6-phosphogluconolactonase (cycloisomerase 2 family)
MRMQVRTVLILMVALATMGLASCDHYNCLGGANFGISTCSATGANGSTGVPTAFVFAADSTGTIDGYTLNQEAGTFAPTPAYIAPTGLPAGVESLGMVVANQKGASTPFLYDLYPSTIYGYSVGPTGDLTPMTPVDLVSDITPTITYNEISIIANPQGTLLFIAENQANTILVYSISTTGALALAASVSTFGVIQPQNLGMDGQGVYLFASNYSSDHAGSFIAQYKVANTGALTLIATYNAPLWEMQGDPGGLYLIGISGNTRSISGSDDDTIYIYSIDQTTGLLTALAPLLTNPAYSPFNIAMQPVAGVNGPLVYSFSINDAGSGENPIEGYQLSAAGALSALSGNPFTGAGQTAMGGFDPTGNYLFIYQEQSMTAYQVSSDGTLTDNFGNSIGLNTGGYWAVAPAPQ